MTLPAGISDAYYDVPDEPAEPAKEADLDDENERRSEWDRDAWE